MRRRVALVVGARPNFVKAGALWRAFTKKRALSVTLIHTGQHYDRAMSGVFLRDLGLPEPDVRLRVGSGSHAAQTARLMMRLEPVLERNRPHRVVVVGDVNSTLAAALVGAKMDLPVDHVEAGLRSGDRRMPEEINRIVTDSVASTFFVSEPAGVGNLVREGHDRASIHHVGNAMIDSLDRVLPKARRRMAWRSAGLEARGYGVVTLHRPANVDEEEVLGGIVEALVRLSRTVPLVFPVHPRTRNRLGSRRGAGGLRLVPPLRYIDFVSLLAEARFVITDSGGVQEEATFLGLPCLTMRDTTERPITVTMGTNTLVGSDTRLLEEKVEEVLSGRYKKGAIPALWDGRASQRIADIVAS